MKNKRSLGCELTIFNFVYKFKKSTTLCPIYECLRNCFSLLRDVFAVNAETLILVYEKTAFLPGKINLDCS